MILVLTSFLFAFASPSPSEASLLAHLRTGEYREVEALFRKRPGEFAYWRALLSRYGLVGGSSGFLEALRRAKSLACASPSPEEAALCLELKLEEAVWTSPPWSWPDPRKALEGLAKKGSTYARFLLAREEKDLEGLVREVPKSPGGRMAAGKLAEALWALGEGKQALRPARLGEGVSPLADGVLAWARYFGDGEARDRRRACASADLWAFRAPSPPLLAVLALCYWEGEGGFPKDPVRAYGLLWHAEALAPSPAGTLLFPLAENLSADLRLQGRRWASRGFGPPEEGRPPASGLFRGLQDLLLRLRGKSLLLEARACARRPEAQVGLCYGEVLSRLRPDEALSLCREVDDPACFLALFSRLPRLLPEAYPCGDPLFLERPLLGALCWERALGGAPAPWRPLPPWFSFRPSGGR